MDVQRVFQVLWHLQQETDLFLVAQDAHVALQLCITQIGELPNAVSGYMRQCLESPEQYGGNSVLIESAESLLEAAPVLMPLLEDLEQTAHSFWLCAPVDHLKEEDAMAAAVWTQHQPRGVTPLSAQLEAVTRAFQAKCAEVLGLPLFAPMKEKLATEESAEELDLAVLRSHQNANIDLFNAVPLFAYPKLYGASPGLLHVGARFPTTHYSFVDHQFATLLGYSRARLYAVSIDSLIVSRMELDNILSVLHKNKSKPLSKKTVLTYRTAARQITVVHWEIASSPINDAFVGVGVDMTQQLAFSRERHDVNMQKILRQWLHSIRNASFEQQAEMLLSDFQDLQQEVDDPRYDPQLSSLCDGLKTLIHSAKTSIGLINQALDTKGLVQLVSVTDFLNSLYSFPINFANAEGIGTIPLKNTYTLNGTVIHPPEVGRLFVKCDMIHVQAFVDNIVSNAVRYTDPSIGIEIRVDLEKADSLLRFKVHVRDFCPGGLPAPVVDFLKQRFGSRNIVDRRMRSSTSGFTSAYGTPTSKYSPDSPPTIHSSLETVPGLAKARSANFRSANTSRSNSPLEDRAANLDRPPVHPSDDSGPRVPSALAPPTATMAVLRKQQGSSRLNQLKAVAHNLKLSDSFRKDESFPTAHRRPSQNSSSTSATDAFDSQRTPPHSPTSKSGAGSTCSSPSLSGMSRTPVKEIQPSGKGRSTGTGLPHLLELYQALTSNGEDFDFLCTTTDLGTRASMIFNGYLNESADEPCGQPQIAEPLDGVLLVADDSAVIRKIFCKYLNTLQIEFFICKDGLDALKWFKEHASECCGVITDLEMPKMGGDALIARVKEIRPEVPCYIVSGLSLDVLPPGTSRAIVKPLSIENVVSILSEISASQLKAKGGK